MKNENYGDDKFDDVKKLIFSLLLGLGLSQLGDQSKFVFLTSGCSGVRTFENCDYDRHVLNVIINNYI